MNELVVFLAQIVREKIERATQVRPGASLEARFIFHGPPLALLEQVFQLLASDGGIPVDSIDAMGAKIVLPVLLQVPPVGARVINPPVGVSGRCDETHLLDLRNAPSSPSFVVLVPPGQHSNRSVASTTEEFGVDAASNASYATFDEWWGDPFIQSLLAHAVYSCGEERQFDEALALAYGAARALDDVDVQKGSRAAVWRLLSRLFSVKHAPKELSAAQCISLACGFPSVEADIISSRIQVSVLSQITEAVSNGFRAGVERLKLSAEAARVAGFLDEFLAHIQLCKSKTAFERATPAYYLPSDGDALIAPPGWWSMLSIDCWAKLLADEPDDTSDLLIECDNGIFAARRGMPIVVRDKVALRVTTSDADKQKQVDVLVERAGAARGIGKLSQSVGVVGSASLDDENPVDHKAPMSYRASAATYNSAATKVISLASWIPGLLVWCAVATKVTPPKKPAGRSVQSADFDTNINVPGDGRYELLLLLSPEFEIIQVSGINDDALEQDAERRSHSFRPTASGDFLVEVEALGKYQVDVEFRRRGSPEVQVCRVFLTCEETNEEGCRSEFERLILMNRRSIDKAGAKSVVQLDRHARSSSLQSWMLEDAQAGTSFCPLVLASDYAEYWAPPDWSAVPGPILSRGQFLHDPRPRADEFQPPVGFIEARHKIAHRIRNTDDYSGLVESAPLGQWITRDDVGFGELIEAYLDAYAAWVAADPEVACWVDVLAICSLERDGRTLSRVPDAIVLTPLHPLRLAWHCVAQSALFREIEGDNARPCPAASILDPNCVPDLITMSLRAPGGIEKVDFLSVECNSDYWSVLWNGSQLAKLSKQSRQAPLDDAFGITVGGISSGFSAAQVGRALEDVSNLLSAKASISLVVSSAGGATDACNEGLVAWAKKRFSESDKAIERQGAGPRELRVFDTRDADSRPDDATIANLTEDTANHVRWFNDKPRNATPDLGIIAQLDSAEPKATPIGTRSPLGFGGLIRHRIRGQLSVTFLSESRQGMRMPTSGNVLADKVVGCMLAIENQRDVKLGLQFAPNVHAINDLLDDKQAGFVAVSSSAIDPACFLGSWLKGAYLWDYDLPSYSRRAGDTSGYYLLSRIREIDRDGLKRVLAGLPRCNHLDDAAVGQVLLEVARRGIPTVRGLSGDDTGATGDLGLFVAVRLLQDQFRISGNVDSLLPVMGGSQEQPTIAIIIPVDPFRGYLSDLTRSLGLDKKDMSLSRPDLLVVGIQTFPAGVSIHLTPIEVKCRQKHIMSGAETSDALDQAKSLSTLLCQLKERGRQSDVWLLAFQHLLLSMVGFGLRVYSQHSAVAGDPERWAAVHEKIAAAILGNPELIDIDPTGRLVVIDASNKSDSFDNDADGFAETIVIGATDAGCIVAGDAESFYAAVRAKVGDWRLLPRVKEVLRAAVVMPTENVNDPVEEFAETGSINCEPVLDVGQRSGTGVEISDYFIVQGKSSVNEHAASASGIAGTGVVLDVGSTTDGFESRELKLNISDTRLNQLNIGVVGDLGTGKTQLLKSLIFQITNSRLENRGTAPRFLIFDYKRDYSSPEFVAATGAKVIRPVNLPLNLFDTSSMGESVAPSLDRFRFFADVLDKVYSGIGPVQRDKLKSAVRNAYQSSATTSVAPTIYDVHREYSVILDGKSDSPMAIIDDLVDMQVFARDAKDTKTFDQFLDGVVVISLDAMGQDDRSKNMLVAIMLNMFYENMLKTPKREYIGISPHQLRAIDSYLLVDEADNIMRYEFDVLRKLLLQGREFGAGVILASQYLKHFKSGGTDYREPLLTWFIHKVPNATSAELGVLGFTSDLGALSEQVKTLANHHCLYKSFGVSGEVMKGLPFYELMERRKAKGA